MAAPFFRRGRLRLAIPRQGRLQADSRSGRVDLSLSLHRPSDRTFYRRSFLGADRPGLGPAVCGSTPRPPECGAPTVFDVSFAWGNDGDHPVWDHLGVLRRPSTSEVLLRHADPENPESAVVFGEGGDQILVSR